jgi:hypothetical protein
VLVVPFSSSLLEAHGERSSPAHWRSRALPSVAPFFVALQGCGEGKAEEGHQW